MTPKEKCAVCGDVKPISKMRNVDTSDGTSEGAWIYACRSEYPQGLGGTCFGKYNRSLHLKPTSRIQEIINELMQLTGASEIQIIVK